MNKIGKLHFIHFWYVFLRMPKGILYTQKEKEVLCKSNKLTINLHRSWKSNTDFRKEWLSKKKKIVPFLKWLMSSYRVPLTNWNISFLHYFSSYLMSFIAIYSSHHNKKGLVITFKLIQISMNAILNVKTNCLFQNNHIKYKNIINTCKIVINKQGQV